MKALIVIVPVLFCVGADLFSTEPSSSQPTGSEKFKVDSTHSSMVFRIGHLGVSKFWGTFNKMSGDFEYDPKKPESTRLTVTIDADSVYTGAGRRDSHLKSPQFFNVKEHPEITFTSTKVERTGDADANTFAVTGELTLLGQKKSVTAEATFFGRKELTGRWGTRAGFEARFSFKRSDFGMTYMIDNGMLGDQVDVIISLEGMLQN